MHCRRIGAILLALLLLAAPFAGAREIDAGINAEKLPKTLEEPMIVVQKEARILQLFDGEEVLREYAIGLGPEPTGHKRREGDGRTPEGEYYVCSRNENSKYHLSFGISYPNARDAKTGYHAGYIDEEEYEAIVDAIERGDRPPWGTALGGEICIHGNGGGSDWTAGCIAIEDAEMDELWEVVEKGCVVCILP